MRKVVLLDSSPLGLLTSPNAEPASELCQKWLIGLLAGGIKVYVPEITDYELRRELLRAGKQRSIRISIN